MDKVIVITGPTAVGKTKLSISIAKYLNTDVINSDAYQVYKKLNIATAKITKEEMEGVTHHLLDILEPTEEFSVYDYQLLTRNKISEMINNHKTPLLVGGSGLYIDSVIKNYQFDEEKRDPKIENKYKDLSNEELHQILVTLNKEKAEEIHFNNRKRVLRAIELELSDTNKENRLKKNENIYDSLVIFLYDDREILYERINKRVDQMIKNGLLEEAKYLYDHNLLSKTSKATIGYKELFLYFNNEITLEEAIDLIKKNSRHYAKRQMTWFNNKDDVIKVKINLNDFNQTIEEVKELINNFIKKH